MGWFKAGGEGPGGGDAGGGLKGTRMCWVTSWVTMEVSRTLTTLWILLAVTQLPGKCERRFLSFHRDKYNEKKVQQKKYNIAASVGSLCNVEQAIFGFDDYLRKLSLITRPENIS